MDRIILPKDVEIILDRLSCCGYQAYVVGGCVRDSIMGVTPHDWDICTSALPDEIISVFSDMRVIPTGLKHGTITVVVNECEYEITTFRTDGEYLDCRHPEKVEFVNDLKSDLMRRDFTINAMAYSPDTGLIDYFSGLEDIDGKVIKCVGNANDRFSEDALRIMRAIRFAARYGFKIEPNTRMAMFSNADLLKVISKERINSELYQTINIVPAKVYLLEDLIELLKYVLPELKDADSKRMAHMLDGKESVIRLAIMFGNLKISCESILRELKFSNAIIKKVIHVLNYGNVLIDLCNKRVTKNMSDKTDILNDDDYYINKRMLLEIGLDLSVSAICYASAWFGEEYINRWQELYYDLFACEEDPGRISSMSDLKIDGNDLAILGYNGKSIGNMLKILMEMVLRDVLLNNKEDLTNAAKALRGYI